MSLRSLPTQTILGLEEAENTLSADPKVQKEEQQHQERQRWHSKAEVGGEGTSPQAAEPQKTQPRAILVALTRSRSSENSTGRIGTKLSSKSSPEPTAAQTNPKNQTGLSEMQLPEPGEGGGCVGSALERLWCHPVTQGHPGDTPESDRLNQSQPSKT